MLREHYPVDKLFEEIAVHFPKMDPALAKVDAYLEDEKLYQLIKKDLSKRWPKTLPATSSPTFTPSRWRKSRVRSGSRTSVRISTSGRQSAPRAKSASS